MTSMAYVWRLAAWTKGLVLINTNVLLTVTLDRRIIIWQLNETTGAWSVEHEWKVSIVRAKSMDMCAYYAIRHTTQRCPS